MYGLFLLVCYTFQPCDYQPQGFVYPDLQNCAADILQQDLSPSYTCLPVDAVVRAKDDL